MPSTATPHVSAGPATPPVSPSLGLILSAGEDALLTDLGSKPQTVGAGPRCTVRLEGQGLRPMHCVVTPTAKGPVIRRWATETLLNGTDFTEALLVSGDRLQIGPSIELEVVELPLVDEETDRAASSASESAHALPKEQPPVAELPPAESPATELPATGLPEEQALEAAAEGTPSIPKEEWFDAGIEQIADHLQEITANEPLDTKSDIDPAIPGRLLQPWTALSGEGDAAPVVKRDTASSAVPLNPFNETPAKPDPAPPEAEEVEEAVTETADLAVEAADSEWVVPTPIYPPSAEAAEEPVRASAEAWAAEFAGEPTADLGDNSTLSAVDASDTAAAAGTPAALDSFESVEPVAAAPPVENENPQSVADGSLAAEDTTPVAEVDTAALAESEVAFQAASAQVARLRDRLRSNRERVASLVAALRQRREEIASLESALGERDQLIAELQTHLQEALDIGEAARAELAQWQEAADAAAADEPTAAEVVAALNPEIEDELAAAQAEAEQIAADLAATAPTDPGVESVEAFYEQPTESDEPTPEPVDSAVASESLWGIEELAQPEQSPAAADAPLWGAPADLALPVEAPVEAPSEPTDRPDPAELQAPQEETIEEAAAEETSPVAELEPAIDEPETAATEEEPVEEERVEIAELIAKAAAKTAFDPLAKAEESSHAAPASFIEQYAHTLPEDDESTEPPAPIETPAEPPIESATETPDEGDDDSIDDYMRKLMERVRGESSPAAPAEAQAPAAAAAAVAAREPVLETGEEDAGLEVPTPESSPIKCLSEMKRGPVRQATTDMGALRQLANQSARHAIDVANTRDNREQATLRLTGSAIAAGCGALAAITAVDLLGPQFLGGIAGMLAGGWFGIKTLKSCQLAKMDDEVAAVAAPQPLSDPASDR